MRKSQIDGIANALGRLHGRPDIDERTRRECVDAVENALQWFSTKLDKSEQLKEFRQLAKRDLPK